MVGFGLALLGGNFFPPGALPDSFEKLSRLTPNGVALQAFAKLSIDGGTLRSIVPSLLALLAIGAVTGFAAVARLGREVEPA
jgi:ABC-type multidrug transport system permease subunit